MKKIALLLAVLLAIVSCVPAFAENEESVSVAIVYADTVDDKGWCQSMDNGVKKAIEMGYKIDYTPVESVQVPDAVNTLEQLAENYDIIIVHGAQFGNATTEVAADYPDQVFAFGTSDKIFGDNIFTYMPMSEEPGYINGVIAALTTKTGKVGIVGSSDGGDSARYVRGFVKGMKDTKPELKPMLNWTGSFSDTVGAGDIAKTFVQAGCDVLTGTSQQAVGALRIVDSAEGVIWLGQTTSQIVDFPNVVSVAADYDYSAVLVELINRVAAGKKGGENIPLNYNNGGFVYTYSENAELLPEDVKAAAQTALEAVTATPNTIDFASVELN